MTPFTPEEKKKFERIKDLSMGVISKLDNNKELNIKRYDALFKSFEANPDLFRSWSVLHDDSLDSTLQILQLPFEECRMNQIKNAADFLGISLEDYIYYRQNDPRGIRSKMKVPVGYVNIKRVQQILSKKNHYSTDIDDRSLKTGDVKGESKVSGISDNEVYALKAMGADEALKELLGPRSDNQAEKRQMYRDIAQNGFTSLEDIKAAVPRAQTTSTTLNTINTYLLACGISSDLITNTLETEFTLDQALRKK